MAKSQFLEKVLHLFLKILSHWIPIVNKRWLLRCILIIISGTHCKSVLPWELTSFRDGQHSSTYFYWDYHLYGTKQILEQGQRVKQKNSFVIMILTNWNLWGEKKIWSHSTPD